MTYFTFLIVSKITICINKIINYGNGIKFNFFIVFEFLLISVFHFTDVWEELDPDISFYADYRDQIKRTYKAVYAKNRKLKAAHLLKSVNQLH